MTKLACIFPGQGSQEIGMGKAFYENFPAAKLAYEEVDDALDMHLSQLMFDGDAHELTQTANAQPAIMVTSIAILRVLEAEAGFELPARAAYVAGHSLGEYSALCAAGTFSLADTARLLRTRGQAMQDAAPAGTGAMAAILGLDIEEVEKICAEVEHGICEVANDNAPGQVVISGELIAVDQAMSAAKDAGAKRAITLNVSAPFHSSLIASAGDVMRDALAHVDMETPSVPLIANVTVEPVTETGDIRDLLVRQVTGRVRWSESIAYLVDEGVTTTLEIGHGNVLSGLNRRINRELESLTVNSPEDIDAFAVRQAS